MATRPADDDRRLEELCDLGATDLRHRLSGMIMIAVTYVGFTGWRYALAWWAVATVVHLTLGAALRAVVRLRASIKAREAIGFAILALSHLLTGSLAIAAALMSRPWGLVFANLFLATLVIYAVRAGARSVIAFRAALIPYGVLLAALPIIALYIGAPIVVGVMFAVATAVFVHHFLGAHRTALLAIAVQEAARARAEAATEAKSNFVAMVSHELRTPISGMLAGSADLERSAPDRASRSSAALIGNAARMMRVLLDDLLDLSKIEAGRMTVEHIAFDLRALVLDATRFWRPETAQRGLRFRLEGAHALPRWVLGDPTRLRQILNNLASNALKFTGAGSVTLRFAVARSSGDAVHLQMDVIDTGPGMTEAQVSRLFQAFGQLRASTARTHGGTGLGLTISRQLAELMSGALEAESCVGVGTTFRLSLPLHLTDAPDGVAVAPQPDQPNGLRVLVADDHPVNRRAFEMMLAPICAEVVCVENGAEALNALAARPFDVVLMDLNMPVMGGLETVTRLRAEPGPNRDVAVVALTASVSERGPEACRAVGMDGFAMKPIEAQELLETIDAVLSEREALNAASG